MVRLVDISKESGISLTQVSRALNGHSDVSEVTRKKVLETAKKLGYFKNIHASLLASGTVKQISVIIMGLENDRNNFGSPSIIDTLKGINRFSGECGYDPAIYLLDYAKGSLTNFCNQRDLKGVILIGANYDDSDFRNLISSDVTCVTIDIPLEGTGNGCILVNNYYYALEAVRILIHKGLKKIAMFTGNKHAIVSVERESGYRAALSFAGIKIDEELIINCEYDYNLAYENTKLLMKNHSEIDGIFCGSDIMALGALHALNELGKNVPQDVSVFGFDGLPAVSQHGQHLATIVQDNFRKGYAAANLLQRLMSGEDCEKTVVIPCAIENGETI